MEVDLVHIINEIRSLKLESKSFIIGWLSHTESKPSLTRLLFLVIDHITAAIVIRLHYHLLNIVGLHKKLLLKIVTWQSVKIQTSWGCHDFSHYWKRSLFTIKNSKHALASQPHWHQCMDWMSIDSFFRKRRRYHPAEVFNVSHALVAYFEQQKNFFQRW